MTPSSEQETTAPWDASQVNLTSKELAPGVFAVMPDYGAYSLDERRITLSTCPPPIATCKPRRRRSRESQASSPEVT